MTLRPTKLTRNPLWKAPETHPFKYFQKQLTFGGYIPNGYSGKVPLGSANWTADVKTTADTIIHKAKCKRIELRAHACCQSEQPRHVRRIQSLGMRHVLRKDSKSGFPFRLHMHSRQSLATRSTAWPTMPSSRTRALSTG